MRIELKDSTDFPHGYLIQDLNDFLGTEGTCLNIEKIDRSKVLIARWSWSMRGRVIKSSDEEGRKAK